MIISKKRKPTLTVLVGKKGIGRSYWVGEKKEFTTEELRVIAKALNILKIQTPEAMGVVMNTYHFTRFYNDTHYIDSDGRFKVYKKYKGWKPNEVKTW